MAPIPRAFRLFPRRPPQLWRNGPPPYKGARRVRRVGAWLIVGLLAVTLLGFSACQADDAGVPELDPWTPQLDARPDLPIALADAEGGGDAGAPGADTPSADTTIIDAPLSPEPLSPEPPPAPAGLPGELGCADGTREGFMDSEIWPRIAGCAGGFSVQGFVEVAARAPQCGRAAGNTGPNPEGLGCSAADLCAPGWHVCEDAGEVALRSATGCAGAAPAGYALFFAVRAGASPDGLCAPGAMFRNDLHGCGSWGGPEHPSCAPLDRRMDFAACLASDGLWSCGDVRAHLQETTAVTKAGPGLGGVLCCYVD